MKGVHPEREHRQIRTICPYVECSKLVVDIKNHIRMVHLKVRNYSCDECDANFVNNYQVRKHKEGVHSNGSRIQCEECSMMLKTTTYESHVRRVHRGVRPSVPCDEEGCGKVFGSKAVEDVVTAVDVEEVILVIDDIVDAVTIWLILRFCVAEK